MTTITATGYRITFEKHDTILWTNLGRGFVRLMIGLWAPFSMFPLTASGMERYKITRNLYELGRQYLDEASRCSANNAFFAAGIAGCSMVEAILMLACVRDRDMVFQTHAWKAFAKKKKKRGSTLSDLLPWIDFGNLISIGKELDWFSPHKETTENFFAAYRLDDNDTEVDDMLEELPEMMVSPLEAVNRVHELRNFLHPGKCIRQGVKIEEKMAKLTLGLAYMSLMGVLDSYQGEPAEYIDLEVPASIRNTLGWTGQVDSSAPELALEGSNVLPDGRNEVCDA